MDSGERRGIDCSTGVQQRDAMVGPALACTIDATRPTLFCMPFLPVLKRNLEEFEPKKGVEAFAHLDDIVIGMMELTSNTVEVVPFL